MDNLSVNSSCLLMDPYIPGKLCRSLLFAELQMVTCTSCKTSLLTTAKRYHTVCGNALLLVMTIELTFSMKMVIQSMGGLVRRYERGPHTESYGAEKEIGVCDVSQVFLLCTSHNPMRHLDVVEAKDSGKG